MCLLPAIGVGEGAEAPEAMLAQSAPVVVITTLY